MKKRIVAMHYTTWPKIGGLEIAVEELALAAAKLNGCESLLVSGNEFKSNSRYANYNNFSRVTIPEIDTDHSENRKNFESFRKGDDITSVENLTEKILNAFEKIFKPNDLLISFNCFSLPYNISLTRALWDYTSKNKIKHVTWSYDLAITENEFTWKRKKELPWKYFWERCPNLIYTTSSKPVAVTQASALGMDQSEIDVIPAGINPFKIFKISDKLAKIYRNKKLFDKFPLLFTPSKISSRKNIPKSLKIIASLKKFYPDVHLIISGSHSPHDVNTEENSKRLQSEINANDLEENITVIGFEKEYKGYVGYFDNISIMMSCDCVLFTSRREGFLIPILEANMCNVPIVVPNDDSIISWAKDYIVGYSRNANPEKISSIIISTLKNQKKCHNKYQIRSKFSWENITRKYFLKYFEGMSND